MKFDFKIMEPFVKAAEEGKDLDKAFEMVKDADPERRQEEAVIILDLMEQFEPPVIPFQDVTEEQIQRARKELEDRYGFIVWTNVLAGTDEDCAAIVKNDPDAYLGCSETAVREISMEQNREDFENLKMEMDRIDINGLVISGSIGRWNGKHRVVTVRESMSGLFDAMTGEDLILYIKDGQLRAEARHHDGRNHFAFYTFRNGVDPNAADPKAERAEWESLVPILKREFGWEITEK